MAKEPEFCDLPIMHAYWNLKTGMCLYCHKLHPKALPGLKWAARKREGNVKRGIAKEDSGPDAFLCYLAGRVV